MHRIMTFDIYGLKLEESVKVEKLLADYPLSSTGAI
jgi:hypothetical protein